MNNYDLQMYSFSMDLDLSVYMRGQREKAPAYLQGTSVCRQWCWPEVQHPAAVFPADRPAECRRHHFQLERASSAPPAAPPDPAGPADTRITPSRQRNILLPVLSHLNSEIK